MLEKELYKPLKKYFKDRGYKVYPEVPINKINSVDFVAVRSGVQIAVEMKLFFNNYLVKQAVFNKHYFGKSYIAYPVKNTNKMLSGTQWEIYVKCVEEEIGILEVLPDGTIYEELKSKYPKKNKPYNFSGFIEKDDDGAGLPYQNGGSVGLQELIEIEEYVVKNPNARWKDIFTNVSNRYSNPISMAGAMRQSRGFNLDNFKKIVGKNIYIPKS